MITANKKAFKKGAKANGFNPVSHIIPLRKIE